MTALMKRMVHGFCVGASLVGFCFSSSYASPVQPHNVTDEFRALDRLPVPSDFRAKVREYKILLVRGFLSQASQNLLPFQKSDGTRMSFQNHYWSKITRWLQKQKFEYEIVKVGGEETSSHNAIILEESIRNSPKPVIVISHSKGGLDTQEALRNGAHISGWITLETPFRGSPLAQSVADNSITYWAVAHLLQSLGGTPASLVDLEPRTRNEYLEHYQTQIADVLQETPLVALAGWKDPEPNNYWDTPLSPLRNWMLKHGGKNDGLVPFESSIPPAGTYVEAPGVDHFMNVRQSPYINEDVTKLTRTLLRMLVSKIQAH